MRKLTLGAVFSLCTLALPATAQTPVDATPQRPSFTSNTLITAAGTVEMETGFQSAGTETLPTWLKYTPDFGMFNGRVEFTLGFDGFIHDPGISGFGTSLNLIARAPIGNLGKASMAVSPFVSIPIRDVNGPGSFGGTVLFTIPLGDFSMDLNSTYAKLTDSAPTDNHYGNLATAISHPVGKRLSIFASSISEFGSNRPPSHSLMQGVAIQINRTMTLDVAIGQADFTHNRKFLFTAGAVINFGHVKNWIP